MQKLISHLWFDKEAKEAAEFYTSLFEDSELIDSTTISDTPSGDTELVNFRLANLYFAAISAGPFFELNPSISLMVALETKEEVDKLYAQLSAGGSVLMPLDEYPFSQRYGWVADRFGLNWQLMLVENMAEHQRIRPSLLFSGETCGRAEEAIDYYLTVFPNAKKGFVNHYGEDEAEDARAKINYGELGLPGGQWIVMDHGAGGDFTFNEAYSFMIECKTQEEIDFYWQKLSHVPEAEQCGWAKDQFGISWQIVPEQLNEMMQKGTKEQVRRVTEAFLQMKKFDLAALNRAYLGETEAS